MAHTLRSSPPSPFGRKVKLVLAELGLEDRFQIVVTDTLNAEDSIRQQNPLGKIPALVLEDGTAIYDSRVIVEYLDILAGGGKVIPSEPKARIAVLTMQALCDGILDASLLLRYEALFRDEANRSAKWTEHQSDKVRRGLSFLEAKGAALDTDIHVGTITLACTLAYLDFRFAGEWRKEYPALVAWHNRFSPRLKAWEKTQPG